MEDATPISTPATNYAIPGFNTPKKRQWHKGVYDRKEKIWRCNCNPSVPALRLQAKRENENKGRWFYRCHQWESGCNLFLWADEAQLLVEEEDRRTEKMDLVDPPPPSYNYPEPPVWVRPRTPVPSPRPRDIEKQKKTRKRVSNKRSFPENEDESTDIDNTYTKNANELSQDFDVTSSDDEVIENPRKERRISAKDSPSGGTAKAGSRPQGSFATTATTSFVTAPTSFTSVPLTPNTDPRPHRPLNTAEGDIFTTSPLANRTASNLYPQLVSASGSRGSMPSPETPKGRQAKHPPFNFASPTSPESPRGPAQDAYSFLPELGKISADMRELLERQARQAHGFKKSRDASWEKIQELKKELQEAREALQEAHGEIDTLKGRIEELEEEKETQEQVNVTLKSQLNAMRLNSPSVFGMGTRASSIM